MDVKDIKPLGYSNVADAINELNKLEGIKYTSVYEGEIDFELDGLFYHCYTDLSGLRESN